MLIYETDRAMSELSRKIMEEVKASSYRALADKTGVSHTTLEYLAKERNDEYPKMETLEKLATYWKLPLGRVIEMAGVDLGYPKSLDELMRQLNGLSQRLPEIEPIVQYLLKLYPGDLRGVVAYLESVDRQHSEAQGWSGEDREPHQ